MITFNEDGTTTIDFPAGPVTVNPPTFGGLKRLRSDRVRLLREARDAVAAWEAEHPEPVAEGEDDPDPIELQRRLEDRSVAVEEANLAAAAAWWKLVLVGDGSFKGLAEGTVPDNVDDWPASLLYDVRPVLPPNASIDLILSAQSMPDQWIRHVGNGRSRYGAGAMTGQTPSQ